MLSDFIQKTTLSIVILGDFNPVIIQPFWLVNKKLIRELEAVDSKVELIHNEFVKYTIGDWCSIEILKDRVSIITSKELYFLPLKDLISNIFSILIETPIRSFGINHTMHFQLSSKEQYYNFGNKLAPLSNWSNFLNDPRVLNVEIVEEKREDGLKGTYKVKISPSDIGSDNTILISTNDHFDLGKETNANLFVKLINDNFDSSINRARSVVENIWDNINK